MTIKIEHKTKNEYPEGLSKYAQSWYDTYMKYENYYIPEKNKVKGMYLYKNKNRASLGDDDFFLEFSISVDFVKAHPLNGYAIKYPFGNIDLAMQDFKIINKILEFE